MAAGWTIWGGRWTAVWRRRAEGGPKNPQNETQSYVFIDEITCKFLSISSKRA
jgi:hypothetical protein